MLFYIFRVRGTWTTKFNAPICPLDEVAEELEGGYSSFSEYVEPGRQKIKLREIVPLFPSVEVAGELKGISLEYSIPAEIFVRGVVKTLSL